MILRHQLLQLRTSLIACFSSKGPQAFPIDNILLAKIGFIGIGQMGSRMAANLRTRDANLKVADLVPENVPRSLKDLLVPKQHLLDWSDVLFLMLPDGNAVARVIEDISATSSKEFIVLDCSTISPKHSLEFHKKLDEKGSSYFDTPVSGGKPKL